MSTKYIFVTGGVVSSLGKGITASSLGRLLKNRGLKVFMQKFDPYINIDPGTMSPYQHGEVFVTSDGAETDLDLGHYERFIDENLTKNSSVTSGRIYQNVINKERKGEYLGATIQVIPHITNEIKQKLIDVAEDSDADIIITEIGGTVGDIESLPFLEAIRQARRDFGLENTMYVHNTLVPYLPSAKELKTKPTQHSVKELRSLGIQPDVVVLRTSHEVSDSMKDKIALFCDVPKTHVVEARDCDILYEVGFKLHEQNLDQIVCDHFKLNAKKADMTEWRKIVDTVKNLEKEITISLVGKYVSLHDAYLSVVEALNHAGYASNRIININWIDAEKVNDKNVAKMLKDSDGILVPGGFGSRAIEGKISAIKFARENNIPFFGICLGMQLSMIEFARNVLNLEGANTTEANPETKYPIIDYLDEQYDGIDMGGTLRLGNYECKVKDNTLLKTAYNSDLFEERHRHRYEFNNTFLEKYDNTDMVVSGINPQRNLVEVVELKNHRWFLACQFHPEFTSRPNRPQPLFRDFIKACTAYEEEK